MPLEFKPIILSEQSAYQSYLSRCPQISSDYSFINLWSWASVYGLEWSWTDDLVWLRQHRPSEMLWAPVGDWQLMDWLKYFERYPQLKSQIVRVPEQLACLWQSEFGSLVTVTEDRDQFDYIYNAEDLITLKGNRFHKKKNLLNQFKKKYAYQYEEMTPQLVEKAGALQDDWCTWRECDSDVQLANENQAIAKVLSQWENLTGVIGGCIMVDNIMIAYTIGELLTSDTLVIHFEKGSTSYKGAYQALNQMFLEHEASSDVMWVNREQDLGDSGLRQSKLSYHPDRFLQKYRVDLRK
jgi:uncharacterized protein